MFKKKKPMPNTPPDIAEQAEKIALSRPVIQDLDEHIATNHLEPGEKLVMRLLRHEYVNGIRFDLRLAPLVEHQKDCIDNPSLLYLFRHKTGTALVTLFIIAGGFYFFFRVIEIITGLEGVLKLLTP